MKKTDTLMKVVSAFVFVAMLAYLAVYVFGQITNPVQTALAVTATMSDSTAMSGLVVRDELLIPGSGQYIDVTVSDGEKVSVGQAIAVVYGSEAALERATQLDSLQREIESVSAALTSAGGVRVTGNRDKSISDALTGLSAAVRSDDLVGVDTRQSALGSLLFQTEVSDATEDYLAELRDEYARLLVTAAGDTRSIAASESGTYSAVVDGYEGVSPDYVQTLTPSGLREIIAADRTVDSGSIGKLITSFYWYYAAILPKDAADRLETGDSVELSFGRYYPEPLKADVVYISDTEARERVVLFRMDHGFRDMLAVRAVSADLIYSQYAGLRVPLRSLYRYYAGYMTDEDGASLTEGETVTLMLGGVYREVTVSEVGSARRYGDLPKGVESGSELDTRPSRRLVVFVWPWADEPAPNFSAGGGTVTLAHSPKTLPVQNYYDYDPAVDRLCVFTMTGPRAERKKVELIYAGEEYCLLSSEGDDALREGNEVIVQASELHNGKVFR